MTPADEHRSKLLGIFYMLGGGFAITLQDAFSKLLTEVYPTGEIIFYRGLFTFIPIAVLIWHAGGSKCLWIANPRGQLLRAVIAACTMLLIVNSFRVLPLADVIIVLFVGPLIATALATPLLGEKVGLRRWMAVAVGFVGVLIMMQPQGFNLQLLLLLPLAAAVFSTLRDIVTRHISSTENSTSILFYSIVAVTLTGLATMSYDWHPFEMRHLHLFFAAGVLNGIAHFLMIQSFRYAEVSLVSPFKYANVIWAIILGYLIWGELPATHMLIGAVFIVVSGLYIMRHETGAKQR